MYSIHYVLAKLQPSYAVGFYYSVRINRFCIMNFMIKDCMVELLHKIKTFAMITGTVHFTLEVVYYRFCLHVVYYKI